LVDPCNRETTYERASPQQILEHIAHRKGHKISLKENPTTLSNFVRAVDIRTGTKYRVRRGHGSLNWFVCDCNQSLPPSNSPPSASVPQPLFTVSDPFFAYPG